VTTDRFRAHPLTASERPKKLYEYFVTGRGPFPFDMLRYDGTWPASGEDAAKLDSPFEREERRNPRSVKLHSYRKPTVDRWASFGWSVASAAVPYEARMDDDHSKHF
jgi:hypothetical protein